MRIQHLQTLDSIQCDHTCQSVANRLRGDSSDAREHTLQPHHGRRCQTAKRNTPGCPKLGQTRIQESAGSDETFQSFELGCSSMHCRQRYTAAISRPSTICRSCSAAQGHATGIKTTELRMRIRSAKARVGGCTHALLQRARLAPRATAQCAQGFYGERVLTNIGLATAYSARASRGFRNFGHSDQLPRRRLRWNLTSLLCLGLLLRHRLRALRRHGLDLVLLGARRRRDVRLGLRDFLPCRFLRGRFCLLLVLVLLRHPARRCSQVGVTQWLARGAIGGTTGILVKMAGKALPSGFRGNIGKATGRCRTARRT